MKVMRNLKRISALLLTVFVTLGLVQPAKAATPVTITIWSFGNVIEPWAITEYKKLHPEVTLQIKKGELDAHHQSLITAFLAKKTPDIAAVEVSYSGYFRSYPSYFEDLRKAPYNAGSIEKDYLDWRWDQGVGYDGTVFGLPTDVGGMQVAYRVDLFKKKGLPTDRKAVSALWPTWEKFISTGQKYNSKLSAAEKTSCTKKKICYGFIDNAGTIYNAVLNQASAKYYENNNTKDGKLIYSTNPAVKKAFDTTTKALKANIGTRINSFTSDWNVGMNNGIFATILAPAWMMDYIKQQAPKTKGKWDIADLPGGGGNLGGSQLTIPKSAKNKTAAWEFMSWYLAPAQQLTIFKKYGLFPSASSLYDDAALKNYKDPFFNNAPVGAIYTAGALKLKPIFEGKKQRAIDNIFGQALSRVAIGKQTPAAAWQQALSEIKKSVG
jgi:cellobiose transport system substrate-binding protein